MSGYFAVTVVIFCAVGIVFVLWIVSHRARAETNGLPDPERSPFFFIPLAILIIFGAYALVQAHEPTEVLAHVNEIIINVDEQCPPPGPQHTDVLSITVNIGRDGAAELMTCARMMRRPYHVPMRWTRQLLVSKE